MAYTGSKYETIDAGIEMEKRPVKCYTDSLSLCDRIILRKNLVLRLRDIVDIEFVLAMTGIILMMIETELFFNDVVDKTSFISIGIKCFITISTVVLLFSILFSYYTKIQLKALDTGVRNYLTVVTKWNLFYLFLELAICAPHPIPADIQFDYISPEGQTRKVSLDAIMAIIMLTRFYLIGKFTVVHSRLLTDTSTNSIGALNKVKIDAKFVFKVAVTRTPGMLLGLVMTVTFFVNTWAMRACEIYFEEDIQKHTFVETMWLIALTFLTIGDSNPQSYCGRYIAILTGIMGVVTTALLVNIIAQKLEQSRPEKYVFDFVSRMKIESQKRVAAANAIKGLVKMWILRKRGTNFGKEITRNEEIVKKSLKEIKRANQKMAHIGEDAVGLIDIFYTVDKIYDAVERKPSENCKMEMKLHNIENELNKLRQINVQMLTTLKELINTHNTK